LLLFLVVTTKHRSRYYRQKKRTGRVNDRNRENRSSCSIKWDRSFELLATIVSISFGIHVISILSYKNSPRYSSLFHRHIHTSTPSCTYNRQSSIAPCYHGEFTRAMPDHRSRAYHKVILLFSRQILLRISLSALFSSSPSAAYSLFSSFSFFLS